MKPTIYNTGLYKTPGIYKGTGGIYNGRGIYKGGGGDILPPGLVIVEYFNKSFGESKTSGTINNFYFDNTCPLLINGGAPVAENYDLISLDWNTDKIKDIAESGEFTIDYFAKNLTFTGQNASAPMPGFVDNGDYWQCLKAMYCNGDNRSWDWINDSSNIDTMVLDSSSWNNYVICAHENKVRFFVNGFFRIEYNITNRRAWFRIYGNYASRNKIAFAQVALYDYALHPNQANFSVDYNPIFYK